MPTRSSMVFQLCLGHLFLQCLDWGGSGRHEVSFKEIPDIIWMSKVLGDSRRRPPTPTTATMERPNCCGQTTDHDAAVRFPIGLIRFPPPRMSRIYFIICLIDPKLGHTVGVSSLCGALRGGGAWLGRAARDADGSVRLGNNHPSHP